MIKRILRSLIQLVRAAARSGPVIVRGSAYGRSAVAPWWRRLSRWSIVALGFCIFAGAEFALATYINSPTFSPYYMGASLLIVVTAVIIIWRPPLAVAMWLVFSPFVALFLRERAGGAINISFDRVIIAALVLTLLIKASVKRKSAGKLIIAEWLLLLSAVYTKIVPLIQLGERQPLLHIVNIALDLCLVPFVVYCICKASVTEKKHVAWILFAVVLVGLTWGLSGIYEHFAGHAWFSPFIGMDIATQGEHDIGAGRSVGPSGHYYVYGLCLALATYLSLHFAR